MKYRIAEHCGDFWIQVYITKTTGMLWWKKTTSEWDTASNTGYETNEYYYSPCKVFDTLEEAEAKIAEWNTEITYHNI